MPGNGPNLMGRNWLHKIKVKNICYMQDNSALQQVLAKYEVLFKNELGTLRGYEAKLHVEANATPKFFKARSVPYSMRIKVEEELARLVKMEVIEPVQFADWAVPVVPILKRDKTVRLCGDFKITVNPVSKLDRHPIPRVEDLLASLAGGTLFTKLDLSQQVKLDENSKQLVIINTHKGLFRYMRLPFGVSSAPGIFQRIMESLLQQVSSFILMIYLSQGNPKKNT